MQVSSGSDSRDLPAANGVTLFARSLRQGIHVATGMSPTARPGRATQVVLCSKQSISDGIIAPLRQRIQDFSGMAVAYVQGRNEVPFAPPPRTRPMPAIKPLEASSDADDVARLLGQHYGDRSVYLSEVGDDTLLELARSRGLISTDGQLTTEGYRYWQRHAWS